MHVISTRYGKIHIIEADSVVSRSLAIYGEWAMDELNLLGQIIAPGMCVLDIGAFIGTHTLAFSEFVGPQGKVYSFEPRKEIYALLAENISLNNLKNVTSLNIGLAEKEDVLSLQSLDISQSFNFGGLALDSTEKSQITNAYQVSISTIDSLNIEKIDVIKLDVEGMERRVLDGAIKTVLRDRPVIFCECNSLVAGSEMLEFCKSTKYDIYGLLTSAYNPKNFNAVKDNFFGDAKELALILIPRESVLEVILNITDVNLLPVHNLEDLVLPLLFKPQYPYEVLAQTATCASIGIDFPSPALTERDGQIVGLNQTIAERDGQIVGLNQTVPVRDGQIANLNHVIASIYLSTSWRSTRPLREVSLLKRRLVRFGQIFQNYRLSHPGFKGVKRLLHLCIDMVKKGGIQNLRNNIFLYERIVENPPTSVDVVSSSKKTHPIESLKAQLAKRLIVSLTIIFDHNGGGGSKAYSNELKKNIQAKGGMVLRVYCFNGAWFAELTDNERQFSTLSIDALFDVLSMSHCADIVINSLYGYPNIKLAIANIIDLAKTLKSPLDFKVHDFYPLCSSPHLSDFEEKYCGVPQKLETCQLCLSKNHNWYHSWYPQENKPTDIIIWRQPFVDLFRAVDTISIFDSSAIEILRKAFHIEACKIKLEPHRTDYFECDRKINHSSSLHIGYLGALSVPKGGNVVNTLCGYIEEQRLNVPITIVGSSYIPTHPKVLLHGSYIPSDLPLIIEQLRINVILMPSIIPETFSYTISEAMKMGLPIVAFDLGAQGNRVKKYGLGKVVPLNSSPVVILTAIQAVLKKAQELAK